MLKGIKLNFTFVLLVLLLISVGQSGQTLGNDKSIPDKVDGYWFRAQNFIKPHYFFQKDYFNPLGQNYISPSMRKLHLTSVIDHKSSTYNTAEFNQALAIQVIDLSYCLQFDPYVFLGLLYDESRFIYRGTSETDAMGLPQLTTAAIREINHQLGFGPPDTVREGNDELVREKIVKCLNDNQEEAQEFIDIFRGQKARATRAIVKKWIYKDYSNFEEKKYYMKRVLLIGGLYLKILLASQGTYYIESLKKWSALEKYYGDKKAGRQGIKDYSSRVLKFAREFYNFKLDEPIALKP